jgi:hypothetical protein
MTVGRQNAKALLGAIAGFAATPKSPQPAPQDKPIKLGTIDPSYKGFGPARVTFDGEISMSAKYYVNTAGPVAPSSRVWLAPVGKTYVIAGVIPSATATGFMAQIPMTPQNGWMLYSDAFEDFGQFGATVSNGAALANGGVPGNVYATLTSTGIVKVTGLVYKASAPSAGQIIATLPSSMVPARTAGPFYVVGTGSAWLYITTDGAIRWGGGSPAAGYLGLDRITFRAAGYQTFVPVAALASWSNYAGSFGTGDPATAKTLGYTVDSDGIYIYEGVLSGGTTTSGTKIITLPFSINSEVFSACTNGAFVELYTGNDGAAGTGNGINLGSGTSATWLSIAGVVLAPTAAWVTSRYNGAWVTYNANYFTAQIFKTSDGLVLLRGLVKSGATTSNIISLSQGFRPRFALYYTSDMSGAGAVLYVGWEQAGTTSGGYREGVAQASGSNAYVSLSGVCWAAFA